VLVPGALMIASFVSGVIYLDKIHNKRASPFNVPGHTIAITYGAICLMINLVLTFMITMRLLLYRRSIKRLIGPKCAGQYTSIISIMIESGSVLDITVVSMVVLVAVNSPWITLPLLSLTEVEAIAAFMIIIRVAKGIAWSSGTANELIAQHASARRTTSETDIRSVVEPFRITSQMTQMSAAFNFNHPHAVSTLLLTRDLPSRMAEKNTSSEMSSPVSEAETRPSIDLQGYPKTGRSSSGKGENNVDTMTKASDPSAS